MILIVWDTRGDGHDADAVYWCGPTNGHDGQGWSDDIREAIDYTEPGADAAAHDLTVARETVQRAAQRGRVDVQEVL